MSTLATSLAQSLPKPKYTGQDEELPRHTQQKGPRIVGAGTIDESQVVLRKTGPPPYGQRIGWRPRSQEDYGDGGAFPEVPVAQYPLDMGRKTTSSSNALAIQVDSEGKIKYDAIARRGHDEKRAALVQASYKDLIPLRQQANAGELNLSRPSEDEVAQTAERTQKAIMERVAGAVAAQNPKNVKRNLQGETTFVNYTSTSGKQRIVGVRRVQEDPMAPPAFKHKKIPGRPPSPPPTVMHSPPRKLTADELALMQIPVAVKKNKNTNGFTIALEHRLAFEGRGLQSLQLNPRHAQNAEALETASQQARRDVNERAKMEQRLAEKAQMEKEERARALAQKAREEHLAANASRSRREQRRRDSRSRSRSSSYSSSRSSDSRSRSSSRGSRGAAVREELRREQRREDQRALRQNNMGRERKMQLLARDQGRDISEKIALGAAKPTGSGEALYDSRLFNQSSGFASGFNEDQPYDKPLFAVQEGIARIYRPNVGAGDDDDGDGEDGDAAMDRIERAGRFEELGRAKRGFKGAAEAEQRSGPVQFERERVDVGGAGGAGGDDPFGIGKMVEEVQSGMAGGGGGKGGKGKRGYGMQDGRSSGREAKRVRVGSDEDEE